MIGIFTNGEALSIYTKQALSLLHIPQSAVCRCSAFDWDVDWARSDLTGTSDRVLSADVVHLTGTFDWARQI